MHISRARKASGKKAVLYASAAALLALVTLPVGSAPNPGPDDARVLNRLTYGIDDAVATSYATQGRAAFVASQMHFTGDAALPPEAQAVIRRMTINRMPARDIVNAYEEEARRLKDLPEGDGRKAQHKALNERYRFVTEEAQRRHIIRALYSRNQLQEQLTWFWLNHFNVFEGKEKVKLVVADYEDTAIRPHVFGRFRDLLLATLMHPAMLLYLDNAQNAQGHINENYARELLELHTLGVDGGYSQQDVQELARILTGAGLNLEGKPVRLGRRQQQYYVSQGLFAFHPNRHDFGDKVFLGHRITGRGFDEIAEVVDILCNHPATARFVSRKLAVYFMGDEPPANVLQRMQDAFAASHGDIAHTLQVMFDSTEFWRDDYLGRKFKDPVHYVFSAVRLAWGDQVITNYKPVLNWLHALDEPLYGHRTPDGYGMQQKDWASSGQLARRFEVARQIANAGPKLFIAEDETGTAMAASDPIDRQPEIARSRSYALVSPLLSEKTVAALVQARDNREWTALFFSAPEFMYR